MAKVTLITGSANVTPWGQRVEGGVEFDCNDEQQLSFYMNNRRYHVGEISKPPMRGARRRPEPVTAPVPSAAPAPAPVDLSILDQSIAAVRKSLSTGKWDGCLGDLLDAEQAGKTRKGAVEAIQERVARLSQE